MDPANHDLAALSTCTSCQPSDDFSNYWTALLYFKARNGTYKRVPQKPNTGFEGQKGGMTVYYMQNQLADFQQLAKVTAFKPVSAKSYASLPLNATSSSYLTLLGISVRKLCHSESKGSY